MRLHSPQGELSGSKTGRLSPKPICPACGDPMEEGQRTDFKVLQYKGYSVPRRVHAWHDGVME